jgi:hypothetical protein
MDQQPKPFGGGDSAWAELFWLLEHLSLPLLVFKNAGYFSILLEFNSNSLFPVFPPPVEPLAHFFFFFLILVVAADRWPLDPTLSPNCTQTIVTKQMKDAILTALISLRLASAIVIVPFRHFLCSLLVVRWRQVKLSARNYHRTALRFVLTSG